MRDKWTKSKREPILHKGEQAQHVSCEPALLVNAVGLDLGDPENMKHDEKMTSESYDITVIGGGSGGLVAARLAAALGAKTLLIDKARLNDLPTAPQNFKRPLQINATFWAKTVQKLRQ